MSGSIEALMQSAVALHRQGRFAAAEAEYRRALAVQPDDPEILQLIGLVVMQTDRLAEAGDWMQRALAVAPYHPRILFNAAHLEKRRGDIDRAMSYLERAVAADPAFGEAHANLANLHFEARRFEPAAAHYAAALKANPRDAVALTGLGRVHHQHGRQAEAESALKAAVAIDAGRNEAALLALAWLYASEGRVDDAAATVDRALAIKPDLPSLWLIRANILARRGQTDAARSACERARELAPASPEPLVSLANLQLASGDTTTARATLAAARALSPADADVLVTEAHLRLLDGDYASGWDLYEARFGAQNFTGLATQLTGPRWDGRPCPGQTLLLTQEQGMGDAIQFLRFLPRAAALAGRVIVRVAPELLGVAERIGVGEVIAMPEPLPDYDWHASLLSLPALLRLHSFDAVAAGPAYLRADPALVDAWAQRLGQRGGKRVGLVWAGNPRHANDCNRSLRLGQLAALLTQPGVEWVSLQVGPAAEAAAGSSLRQFSGELRSYDETAALMMNLDLVIAVDTSSAHLAGALGRPVWILLPDPPDFRWLRQRSDSPWYPTARLFRRPAGGGWEDVAGIVAEALGRWLGGERETTAAPIAEVGAAVASVLALPVTGGSEGRFSKIAEGRWGTFVYPKKDRYVGRSLARYGEFSEGETDVFRRLLRPGDTVVEAGANIGAHTVSLARFVGTTGRVYAFEPQRILFQMLAANLALNEMTNVVAQPFGLGEQCGEARLPALDYGDDFNFGGVALNAEFGERVRLTTVDNLELGALRLLKADVEGMEAAVVRGAQRSIERLRPLLYVENDREAQSEALIRLIESFGYDLWWHLPPLYNPENWRGDAENIFGGTVSVNLLCAPHEIQLDSRLPKVRSPSQTWREIGARASGR